MGKATLVFDFGSDTIKAGLSTSEKPDFIIPSDFPEDNINFPINMPLPADKKLKKAIANGEIACKERIAFIIGSVFDKLLGENEPDELRVVLTETPFSSLEHIKYLSDFCFDLLEAQAISIKPQAYFTAISYAINTCICLDIGHDVMQCIPLVDDYVIPQAIKRSYLAGHSLDLFTARLTLDMDQISTGEDLKKVREMKETNAEVPLPNLRSKMASIEDNEDLMFNLTCGETLFRPALNEQSASDPDNPTADPEISQFIESLSAAEIIAKSIEASDLPARGELWKNIILTGGTSKLKGLKERLLNELTELNPLNAKPRMYFPEDPITSCWKGEALSAKFDAEENWLFAEQYKADPKAVFEKFRLFGTSFAPPK
ncbi:Actin family protein [Trichomonas vaginalis G3]|uniref:Actin family protein n=1 Tax=Trichomonas vaginalis (strain ATCC PRA-98 / G3) TaxID=412133 RepID=A2DKB8_TRIV3|nr:ATP binding [Trichomonas vaginalis G3]EAY19095.1 Actin family protein [Trichomonas vaginalis G3]KAI5490394.1 ATP binding [Trichomonas vaginalis G3]|eukprot:XP_001580081.1 Actin family protein [Trichomonas vaginalis G3]